MLSHCFFLSFLAFAAAVRFHEFIPDGATHFHGVPAEKYVSSWNRLMEIGHKLNGNTVAENQRVRTTNSFVPGSFVRFEDLDWDQENPRANPFLYQGDVVLSEQQLDYLVETYEINLAKKEKRRFSRFLSTNLPSRLWDPSHFPIPWSIDETNPPVGGAAAIRTALAVWEEKSCVTFEENGAGQHGHLEFYNGGGCSSPVGNNDGWNRISIGDGCDSPTTIAHEVGHSLGLFHTQNRNDAAQYIDFLIQNVNPNETDYLLPKHPEVMPVTRGIPYDYGSAMQYDRFSFAKKKGLATMLPNDRNYNTTMGQNFEIAFTDAMEINMMYCDHICPNKLPCRRGGYTDPNDCTKCRCPAGFAGNLCETLAEHRGTECGGNSLVATKNYQILAVEGNKDCIYRIEAPQDKKIEIVLTSVKFQGEDSNFKSCQKHFVEIKYGAQFQTAGARFCARQMTDRKVMNSLTNEAFVFYKAWQEFSFRTYKFSLRYRIRKD